MTIAKNLIASGSMDLVQVTELREVYRNPKFQWDVVQTCQDNRVRFISIADGSRISRWSIAPAAAWPSGSTVRHRRRDVASLVQKIAYGVRRRRQKGIVHRDPKPANVLMAKTLNRGRRRERGESRRGRGYPPRTRRFPR